MLGNRWFTKEATNPKLQQSDIPGVDPTQLPEVPFATIIRLFVGDSSNHNLMTNLSDITFRIDPESNKPYTVSEYTANSTT